MTLAETVIARQEALAAERAPWEAVWRDIAELVLPRRAGFGRAAARPAGPDGRRLHDATAIHANELLAAGLHGMLTNPAERWFALAAAAPGLGEGDAVARWLEDVERRMQAVFASPASRFAPAIHELYLDLGAFGTAALFIGEPAAGGTSPGGILFRTFHLGEVYPAENEEGRVDAVYRRFPMTARQLVERWGRDGVSRDVRRAAETRPERAFEIVHGVFPRRERDPRRADAGHMPFASLHVEAASRHRLEESGFAEFPYVVPRWARVPGERFGRSPAATMMPDIRMLNVMSRTVIAAAQKAVDPPLLVADDGVIQPLQTMPGGLNYGGIDGHGRPLIQPLAGDLRVDIGLDMMEQRRNAIREAFLVPLMQTAESPAKTATQVLQQTEERVRLMSPILGRLQSELLGPLVGRVFALLQRAGALAPAPPELAGAEITVEYVSPVARAQRAGEVLGLMRTHEVIEPFARHDPAVWDNFDIDALARRSAEVNGVPAVALRDPETVARLRLGREIALAGAGDAPDAFPGRRRRADYRQAFATGAGQRVLADLYRFCGMGQQGFVPGRPDETAFNEGKRRVFLRIAAFLELDETRVRRLMADDSF